MITDQLSEMMIRSGRVGTSELEKALQLQEETGRVPALRFAVPEVDVTFEDRLYGPHVAEAALVLRALRGLQHLRGAPCGEFEHPGCRRTASFVATDGTTSSMRSDLLSAYPRVFQDWQ